MHLTRYSKLIYTLSFVFILFLFVVPNKVLATDYYVAGDTGLDTNNGSMSTPWKTIQKAADTMVAGDTVNVKGNLTYSTTTTCFFYQAVVCLKKSGSLNNNIIYQSWDGTGQPIIDGGSSANGFQFNFVTAPSYSIINGFTIKNTNSAIYLGGNHIQVVNNKIYDTVLGVYNAGIIGGLSAESDSIYIYNNLIYQKAFGIHVDKGMGIIKNNIVLNGTYGIESNTGMYVYLDIDYNNSFNNSISNYYTGILQRDGHDLSVDPKFTDPENYDFTLQESSPMIDAGVTLSDVTDDINGTSRPQGLGYDIGPYETSFSNSNPLNKTPFVFYTPPNNVMTQLATYTGEMQQSQFGMQNTYSSTYVGDLNEDGFDDVLVGGRHTTPNGGFYAFLGKETPTTTNALDADIIIRGVIAGSRISDNVSMGDIDGDGHQELLLTDYNAYKAYIFKASPSFSSTTVASANATISGPAHFGTGSTILGDVNGDNLDDYIVYADTGKKAYLFYGSSTLTDRSYTTADVVYTVDADITFTRPGDVNGDGLKDIIINCTGCNNSHGAIYIFYGSTSLTNKTLSQADVVINGDESIYSFGWWSALSDVNGDNIDDVLTTNLGGKTYVFFGGRNLSNASSIQADLVFSETSNNFGSLSFSVESADMNNDGIDDIIATNNSMPRTYVFYGSPFATNKDTSQADLVFDYVETEKGYFGGPISTGDVNNDGYIDIATGNGQYNQRQGKVWLFTSPHGTPTISTTSVGGVSDQGKVTGNVVDIYTAGGVEFSFDGGGWSNCDLNSNDFTCNLPVSSAGSNHTVRLRYKNNLGVYMPIREYKVVNFDFLTTAGNNSSTSCTTTLNTNLTPSITNLKKLNNSTSVELTLQNSDTNATEYIIEYGTTKTNLNYSALNIPTSSKTYTINKLNPTKQYYFRVRTTNGCGFGNWSATVKNENVEVKTKETPLRSVTQNSAGQAKTKLETENSTSSIQETNTEKQTLLQRFFTFLSNMIKLII